MPYSRPGKDFYFTATKAVQHGAPVTEAGITGVAIKQKAAPFGTGPASNVALSRVEIGEDFAILVKGVVQVPFVSTSVKGDPIYIIAASNTLTKTASGNVKFGVVVEVQSQRGTPSGLMRVDLDLKSTF